LADFDSLHRPKEKAITNRIMKYLKSLSGFAWKQAGGMYGTAGMPDIFYVKWQEQAVRTDEPPGVYMLRFAAVFAFEVKRPGKGKEIPLEDQFKRRQREATDIQDAVMSQLEAAGVGCYVVHSKEEVQKVLAKTEEWN